MPRAPRRAAALFVSSLAAMALPATARAQSASSTLPRGALDAFNPSPAGDSFFSLPSADVPGKMRLSAQVLASYAHDPLVVRTLSGSQKIEWVRDQALLHIQASLEAFRLFKLDFDMPVVMAVGGTSGGLGNISVTSPSGASAGDLRAGLRFALLHQRGFVPAAGLHFNLWAPLGSATSMAGAGVIRYQPGISIGAEYTHFLWGASVGARFQPETASALIGSRVVGGFGAAVRWWGLTVGPEVHYQVGTGDKRDPVVSKASAGGAELLLGARYKIGPISLGAAGGPGFGSGPGTPSYRLIASVGGTFDLLPNDDGDGRAAGARGPAARPAAAPPAPSGPVDTDGDTVIDSEDACPTVVGDPTPGAYRRGCPKDRDRDGIPDVDDRCPDVPGVESPNPEKNGCPLDSDGDGITDDKDACPFEKGKPNADPKKHGCPDSVRIEGSQIIILQQVNFETARDEIKKDSHDLLSQVAAVLKDHPEIARLAVDGHTDNRGGDKPNVNLSERRAIAVVRWLVEHGVDARRLEARGFGARRPIADNKTEAGRARNRRVEFLIRRRTDQGEAGWTDGPIEGADSPPAVIKAPK